MASAVLQPAPAVIQQSITPSTPAQPQAYLSSHHPSSIIAVSASQRHGTHVHALLSLLPILPREDWPRTAALLNIPAAAFEAATRTLETFPQFFSTAPGTITLTEHDLTLPTGTIGRLDRLILTPTERILVDFKTDAELPSSPPPAYVAQLSAYVEALRGTDPRPLRAVLLYTAHNATFWL